MKNLKLFFLGLAIMAFSYSCNEHHEGEHQHENMHNQPTDGDDSMKHDNENKFTYSCPMHPDQGGNEPGQCPKCGMDFEKVD